MLVDLGRLGHRRVRYLSREPPDTTNLDRHASSPSIGRSMNHGKLQLLGGVALGHALR
jgi:hypothetical protein